MIKLNHAPQPYSAVALGKVRRPRILAPTVAVAVIAFSGSALPIAAGNNGALEGDGPGLANTDCRSIVESCLIDM